jgi:CRP-like cAMP-binding protein
MEHADFWAKLEQLQPLSPAARKAVHGLLRAVSVPKGALVQAPGSRCNTVYFVESGLARIFYLLDGKDVTEHFALEYQPIVRAESLFTGQPTSKGIEALEASTLVTLHAPSLFALYDAHPDVERLFRRLFEHEHIQVLRRLESLQFKTAEERYHELEGQPELLRRIPLKYLASYLGITPVSLSRIRAGKKSGRG